jgi:glycosyltransferase involved in cell wall biosynthesis
MRQLKLKNILHLVTSLGVGGRRQSVYYLATGLSPSFGTALIASLEKVDINDPFLKRFPATPEDFGRRSGIEHCVLFRILRYCRKNRIDIIHAHDGASHAYACMTKLLRPSIRVVYTFRRSLGLDIERAKDRIRNRFLMLFTDALVATSRERRAALARSFGCDSTNVWLIHNAVDTDRFTPSRVKTTHTNAVQIVAVATLSAIKNIGLIFRALALLADKGHSFHLTVFGDGPEKASLASLAANLGIAELITMRGHCDDISKELNQFDLFVLAPNMEAFGLVFAEAMAAGLPVVSRQVGGIADIVEDGSCGKLVKSDTPEELAQAIEWFITDRQRRIRAGTLGRERAVRLFSLSTMLENYEQLYAKL